MQGKRLWAYGMSGNAWGWVGYILQMTSYCFTMENIYKTMAGKEQNG